MTGTAIHKLPVQGIIEWDVLNWSQLLKYWQPIIEELPRDSKVLAIGERNGGLSLWLALLGFDVVCTDISDATQEAIALHKKHNVVHRIEYKKYDVVNDSINPEQYDIVIAKSVIGGLKSDRSNPSTRSFEVQKKAVDNIHRLLKPRGYFFSAENMKGGTVVSMMRGSKNTANTWRYLSYQELKQLFGEYSLVQTKTFGILPTLFSVGTLNKFAHFLNKNLLNVMPASSKYIAFTVAQK